MNTQQQSQSDRKSALEQWRQSKLKPPSQSPSKAQPSFSANRQSLQSSPSFASRIPKPLGSSSLVNQALTSKMQERQRAQMNNTNGQFISKMPTRPGCSPVKSVLNGSSFRQPILNKVTNAILPPKQQIIQQAKPFVDHKCDSLECEIKVIYSEYRKIQDRLTSHIKHQMFLDQDKWQKKFIQLFIREKGHVDLCANPSRLFDVKNLTLKPVAVSKSGERFLKKSVRFWIVYLKLVKDRLTEEAKEDIKNHILLHFSQNAELKLLQNEVSSFIDIKDMSTPRKDQQQVGQVVEQSSAKDNNTPVMNSIDKENEIPSASGCDQDNTNELNVTAYFGGAETVTNEEQIVTKQVEEIPEQQQIQEEIVVPIQTEQQAVVNMRPLQETFSRYGPRYQSVIQGDKDESYVPEMADQSSKLVIPTPGDGFVLNLQLENPSQEPSYIHTPNFQEGQQCLSQVDQVEPEQIEVELPEQETEQVVENEKMEDVHVEEEVQQIEEIQQEKVEEDVQKVEQIYEVQKEEENIVEISQEPEIVQENCEDNDQVMDEVQVEQSRNDNDISFVDAYGGCQASVQQTYNIPLDQTFMIHAEDTPQNLKEQQQETSEIQIQNLQIESSEQTEIKEQEILEEMHDQVNELQGANNSKKQEQQQELVVQEQVIELTIIENITSEIPKSHQPILQEQSTAIGQDQEKTKLLIQEQQPTFNPFQPLNQNEDELLMKKFEEQTNYPEVEINIKKQDEFQNPFQFKTNPKKRRRQSRSPSQCSQISKISRVSHVTTRSQFKKFRYNEEHAPPRLSAVPEVKGVPEGGASYMRYELIEKHGKTLLTTVRYSIRNKKHQNDEAILDRKVLKQQVEFEYLPSAMEDNFKMEKTTKDICKLLENRVSELQVEDIKEVVDHNLKREGNYALIKVKKNARKKYCNHAFIITSIRKGYNDLPQQEREDLMSDTLYHLHHRKNAKEIMFIDPSKEALQFIREFRASLR